MSQALPVFYPCGSCDQYHPVGWDGDCRDDANRFTGGQLDKLYGPYGWIESWYGAEEPEVER